MYKQQIKVLDCTIRDGGLINDHQFSHEFVRKVYKAVADAGIDYCELGYRNSSAQFSPEQYGPWKFCQEDDLHKVVDGIESHTKISVMMDIGRADMDSMLPASESVIDMVRVACYVKDVDKAIYMVNELDEKGYETCINIMAISRDLGPELDEALFQIDKETNVIAVYIVDSFGALTQESTKNLVHRFDHVLKRKNIGIHAHNNMQLGFGNTIEAIINGTNFLDATIYGIGRAAGNCPLELLMGFLKNPKFDIRPILDIIQHEFLDLRKEIEWGYIIPYMIAGMMNEHPRDAMALRDSENKDNYREFYEKLSNPLGGF